MSYLDDSVLIGKPDGDQEELANLESQLIALEDRLREVSANGDAYTQAGVKQDMARVLTGLEKGEQAWDLAREAFDVFLAAEEWEKAAEACDILFLSGQPDSLIALGQGIWLGVTYPIDPELTLSMLQHVVDETADDADGAAIAAATGAYIVELRAEGKKKENLAFFANQLMGVVARRHGNVEGQEQFDYWFKKLELDDPSKFLVRLRNVVDVLVQDDWWFDREVLQAKLPVN